MQILSAQIEVTKIQRAIISAVISHSPPGDSWSVRKGEEEVVGEGEFSTRIEGTKIQRAIISAVISH